MENKNIISDEVRPRKWLLIVLIIVALIIVVILANKVITDRNNKIKKEEEKFNQIFDKVNEGFENITEESNSAKDEFDQQMNEAKINMFNSSFEFYSGSQYGTAVSMLLDSVVTNNKKEKEHIINVVYGDVNTTGETEVISIKQKLDNFTKYEVSIDYDENGYVNKITIRG